MGEPLRDYCKENQFDEAQRAVFDKCYDAIGRHPEETEMCHQL